ncbi:MAG: DUF364 domain-containing protein [Sulfolobaceae archaeon]
MILNEIIEELSFILKQRRVVNMCVGIAYTAVMLDDGSLGVSHTIPEGSSKYCGEIISTNPYEVVKDIETPLSRSIALAILNAIKLSERFERGDILTQYSGNKLCVFGFSPNVNVQNFSSIIIYDFYNPQYLQRGKIQVKPFNSFTSERCDVAAIFGSALINSTIDYIVNNTSTDHLLLVGISSVYAPKTLKSHGFEAVERLEFIDKYKVFRAICEGATARDINKYVVRTFKRLE